MLFIKRIYNKRGNIILYDEIYETTIEYAKIFYDKGQYNINDFMDLILDVTQNSKLNLLRYLYYKKLNIYGVRWGVLVAHPKKHEVLKEVLLLTPDVERSTISYVASNCVQHKSMELLMSFYLEELTTRDLKDFLKSSIQQDKIKNVKYLISKEIIIDGKEYGTKNVVIKLAVKYNYYEIFKYILKKGIEWIDAYCLYYKIIKYDRLRMLKLLLKYHPDDSLNNIIANQNRVKMLKWYKTKFDNKPVIKKKKLKIKIR